MIGNSIFTALYASEDQESTISISFGVTYNFSSWADFTNTESMNNDDRIFLNATVYSYIIDK